METNSRSRNPSEPSRLVGRSLKHRRFSPLPDRLHVGLRRDRAQQPHRTQQHELVAERGQPCAPVRVFAEQGKREGDEHPASFRVGPPRAKRKTGRHRKPGSLTSHEAATRRIVFTLPLRHGLACLFPISAHPLSDPAVRRTRPLRWSVAASRGAEAPLVPGTFAGVPVARHPPG